MNFYKKHKRGILGTVVFHAIVLMLLIIFGFFTPLPLPGEEGILVNFGDSEQGLGQQEPRPQRREPAPPEPVQQQEQEETAPPPPPTTAPPQQSQPEPAEEVAMTQDFEETAAIDAAEKKRQEEAERKRQIEEERRKKQQDEQRRVEQEKQRQAEVERQRLAEIERQRQAEIERQRQAELERKRIEEAERKKREEEQRRINEINQRAEGAFGGNNQGTTGQGNSDSQSQGTTFPGGNQGVPTGDPNAGTYGPGGSGSGDQGSGVSYSLTGRSINSIAKPNYPGNDEGLVVVKITVDRYGKVTAAEAGARGTTIMEKSYWNEARQAALKTKFNFVESAPAYQQGTISYRFRLD